MRGAVCNLWRIFSELGANGGESFDNVQDKWSNGAWYNRVKDA